MQLILQQKDKELENYKQELVSLKLSKDKFSQEEKDRLS